jgi:hypothetical protein
MARKSIELEDGDTLDIIYKDYRFNVELSNIEPDEQLPEFDMMLFKGEESLVMPVNCWGKHLTTAKARDAKNPHVRLAYQICIPFGEKDEEF